MHPCFFCLFISRISRTLVGRRGGAAGGVTDSDTNGFRAAPFCIRESYEVDKAEEGCMGCFAVGMALTNSFSLHALGMIASGVGGATGCR